MPSSLPQGEGARRAEEVMVTCNRTAACFRRAAAKT